MLSQELILSSLFSVALIVFDEIKEIEGPVELGVNDQIRGKSMKPRLPSYNLTTSNAIARHRSAVCPCLRHRLCRDRFADADLFRANVPVNDRLAAAIASRPLRPCTRALRASGARTASPSFISVTAAGETRASCTGATAKVGEWNGRAGAY